MTPNEIKKCDGIHMTPCYKNFTLILSLRKEREETGVHQTRQKKNAYPFICQLCKQYRKQHNNIHFIPTKPTTKYGEKAIKKAAEISDPKLYIKIKDVVDLIAKEFSYHIII